jgi:hypothetical protein
MIQPARDSLPVTAFEEAWASGQALTLEQAVAYAQASVQAAAAA